MSGWSPEQDLERLLDALTGDLLLAPVQEFVDLSSVTGRDAHAAVRDMRRLIDAADASLALPILPHFQSLPTRSGARTQ